MGRPPIQIPRLTFRLPDSLKEQIEASAKANGRSLNAEIVERLQDSFNETDADVQARVDELERQMVEFRPIRARLEEYLDENRPGWRDALVEYGLDED